MSTNKITGAKKIILNQTWAFMVLGLALNGCKTSQNASSDQVLHGYQPQPLAKSDNAISKRLGPNEFCIDVIRIPTVEKQRNDTWCWAASTAALLNYYNIPFNGSQWTQDDLIRQMDSHSSNQSAGEYQVVMALAPAFTERYYQAKAEFQKKPHLESFIPVNMPDNSQGYYEARGPNLPDARGLVDELTKGHPVIVAIDADKSEMGHVVVATGARFSLASTDVAFGTTAPYFVREIYAIDPQDGKPISFKAFTQGPGEENNAIDRVAFAVSQPMAQDYVIAWTNSFSNPVWVASQNNMNTNTTTYQTSTPVKKKK